MIEIELPQTWNEEELKQKLSGKEGLSYRIERDYTETLPDKVSTKYYPARIIALDDKTAAELEKLEPVLKAEDYTKTQEEYLEEVRPPTLETRLAELEKRVTTLEGRK